MDEGGIAPDVFALPVGCAPTRKLMSSMIAAVDKTAFVARIVMVASLRSGSRYRWQHHLHSSSVAQAF
jgi:hypothetical protein